MKAGEEKDRQKERDARWPYQEYGLFHIKFIGNAFDQTQHCSDEGQELPQSKNFAQTLEQFKQLLIKLLVAVQLIKHG